MKKLMLLAALGLMVASCSVFKNTQNTSKVMYVNDRGIEVNPVQADLEVSEVKTTGTSSSKNSSIDALKNEAVAEVLNKINADVLVEPQYKVETVGNNKTVTVKGYPATYKNFKKADPNNSIQTTSQVLLNNTNMVKPQEEPQKKKKPWFWQAVGGVALFGLGLLL